MIMLENEKIEDYYYIIEGVVNCYKHRDNISTDTSKHGQFVKQISGPKPLGEGIYSPGLVRSASYRA
jgi:hypothetical protein